MLNLFFFGVGIMCEVFFLSTFESFYFRKTVYVFLRMSLYKKQNI